VRFPPPNEGTILFCRCRDDKNSFEARWPAISTVDRLFEFHAENRMALGPSISDARLNITVRDTLR